MIKARPITVSEAASRLGVSPQRVRQFISEGRLEALAVSPRLYLIDPAELRKFKRIKRFPGRPAK